MNEGLIRKAKKGDKDAFCRLMDENVQSMYKIAAASLDENWRQGSRRYGSGTGSRIYILCNQSSNGKEYSGCRRAF